MLISQNDPIHHSFAGEPPADDLILAKRARRLAADAVLRCCFAVIPLFSWLLFILSYRQRVTVCATNRVSTADNSLQITAETARLREGRRGYMQLSEERAGDRFPFFLQGCGRGGAAGAAVPAAGVAQIAFDAVQVGVRPGAVRVRLLLRALMRQVPVALGFPPQRLRRHAQPLGRRLFGERAFVGFEIHLKSPLGTLLVTPAGGRDCRASDNNRRRPARTRACRSKVGGRETPPCRSCRHSWRRRRSCAPVCQPR